MTSRNIRRPIATISESSIAQRSTTSVGVAAVSDSEGIGNCGAGPGEGPTAKVNAPRTGWPSAEMTRQYTRYQPCLTPFTDTTSVVPSPGGGARAPAGHPGPPAAPGRTDPE